MVQIWIDPRGARVDASPVCCIAKRTSGAFYPQLCPRPVKVSFSMRGLSIYSGHHYLSHHLLRIVCSCSRTSETSDPLIWTLKALRHVSALKGLSHLAAPSETETPGDRTITLLYVPFPPAHHCKYWCASHTHTHTHIYITYSRRDAHAIMVSFQASKKKMEQKTSLFIHGMRLDNVAYTDHKLVLQTRMSMLII